MAFDQTWGLWHVVLGSTGLAGVTRAGVTTGSEVRAETTDGQVSPRVATVQSQQPRAHFDTMAIKAALNLCGLSGLSLASSNLTMWAAGQADGGQRDLSASVKYTAVKGILVPDRLSAQHGSDATIGYAATIGYDGTNAPVGITSGTAPDWTTPPAGYDERFTVGPCLIAGVVCEGVKSIDINFGFQVVGEAADGEIWPRIVSIRTCSPTVTIRGIDLAYFGDSAIPLTGKACTAANTKLFFRRRKNNGGFYANADAQHMLVAAPGLATIEQAYDASGNAIAECTVTINCTYDGSNLPLAFTPSSAISLS